MQVIFRATLQRQPFEMMYLIEHEEKYYTAVLDNPDDHWNENQEWKEVEMWYREDGSIFWYKNIEKENIITIKQ